MPSSSLAEVEVEVGGLGLGLLYFFCQVGEINRSSLC